MSTKDEKMTKQIRVYEHSAMFLYELGRRYPEKRKPSIADILDDLLRERFPEKYDQVIEAHEKISEAFDKK
jgi:hypothetical protein